MCLFKNLCTATDFLSLITCSIYKFLVKPYSNRVTCFILMKQSFYPKNFYLSALVAIYNPISIISIPCLQSNLTIPTKIHHVYSLSTN